MKNLSYLEKIDVNGKLDKQVEAICECLAEKRLITYRALKNKWPHCSCRQSMKVLVQNASISP
jgi:hypothetical protein